jgi:hypothetical protein
VRARRGARMRACVGKQHIAAIAANDLSRRKGCPFMADLT